MPRQVRIEFEGGLYHVMALGNQRNRIFASPDGGDESLFLETPGRMLRTFRFPNLVMGPDGQPLSPHHQDTLGQSGRRHSWITDRLRLRSGDNVSGQVRKLSTRAREELSPEIQAWTMAFE